jgi:hypothetical protein
VGTPLEFVEWLDEASCERLAFVGVVTTDQLLLGAGPATARATLSQRSGIDTTTLLRWARLADLMRLEGLRDQHAMLLYKAGITSMIDLPGRDPAAFVRELRKLNVALTIARSLPSESQVAQWIRDAVSMAPAVEG